MFSILISYKKYVNFTFKEKLQCQLNLYTLNHLPNLFSNNIYFLKSLTYFINYI